LAFAIAATAATAVVVGEFAPQRHDKERHRSSHYQSRYDYLNTHFFKLKVES